MNCGASIQEFLDNKVYEEKNRRKVLLEGLRWAKWGKYEEALKKYDYALKLDPYDKKAQDAKIVALQALGRNDEAKNYADEVKSSSHDS